MAVVRRGATVVDIGPAAASGVDGLAAIGRLSAVKGSDSGSLEPDTGQAAGYGAIERRKATPEELARFDGPDPAPSAETRAGPAIHLLRSASHVQMNESRHRGGEVTRELRAQQRPAPRSAQGTADERPRGALTGNGRVVGTPARTEAPLPAPKEEEPMALEAAPPATPFAGVLIPCTDCLHEPVCYLKREIPKDPNLLAEPMVMGPGLRLVTTGVRIECDHHLGEPKQLAPEPIRAEYGGESWRTAAPVEAPAPKRQPGRHRATPAEAQEKAERARRVLEALERHGGDRAAAAKSIQMRPNAFAMVLKFAERHAMEATSA